MTRKSGDVLIWQNLSDLADINDRTWRRSVHRGSATSSSTVDRPSPSMINCNSSFYIRRVKIHILFWILDRTWRRSSHRGWMVRGEPTFAKYDPYHNLFVGQISDLLTFSKNNVENKSFHSSGVEILNAFKYILMKQFHKYILIYKYININSFK